jgi:hypothetical protein
MVAKNQECHGMDYLPLYPFYMQARGFLILNKFRDFFCYFELFKILAGKIPVPVTGTF